MKIKDLQQLHAKTLGELETQVKEIVKKIFDIKMQSVMRQEKNVRLYKTLRHDLARYRTIIRRKQIEAINNLV